MFAFDDSRLESESLEVRQANRKRIAAELEIVRGMLNASFTQRAYYTTIGGPTSSAYQVDGLGYLIDERIALYLYKAGKPVAFMFCNPGHLRVRA